MRKLIAVILMLMLMLASCGGNSSTSDTGSDVDYEVEQEAEEEVEEEMSALEGKWVDDAGITELVVEGNNAVLNDRCVGTAYGEELDFPNDYKKTEASLIDGKLYLTVTPFDWVLEDADVPTDQTVTVELSKVEE